MATYAVYLGDESVGFVRVDTNKSGTITGTELQKALVNGNGTEFNKTTVDSMISKYFYISQKKLIRY